MQRMRCDVSQKTWGGRFSGETDDRVERFTESISFDRRLYREDVRASQAHACMLGDTGLLTPGKSSAAKWLSRSNSKISTRTSSAP
jgi:argininosuccinate lyase